MGESEWFDYQQGVKHGGVLSLLLFTIYIADLTKALAEVGGVKIGEASVAALFFANDMVILAETEEELELKLKVFNL